MSSRSKQLQAPDRGERGSGSHRERKPLRPLVTTAAVIGGAGIVLGVPVAALFIGAGVAQAAPLVSAPQQPPTELCGSVIGCNDLSASNPLSGGSSLFGGSAALAALPVGTNLGDPF